MIFLFYGTSVYLNASLRANNFIQTCPSGNKRGAQKDSEKSTAVCEILLTHIQFLRQKRHWMYNDVKYKTESCEEVLICLKTYSQY